VVIGEQQGRVFSFTGEMNLGKVRIFVTPFKFKTKREQNKVSKNQLKRKYSLKLSISFLKIVLSNYLSF